MATIADIKKRATELSGKTAPNSITPKEVGQLFYDLAGAAEGNKGDGGVPVVDIAGLDGYNLNAGVIMATGPMRFAVACDVGGPAQYSVGVCEMFSDNMMHQTTQVLTTHYTLDADGTVNRGAHTDGRLHTYWRSCKIGGDAAWGAWTPLYSYNGDGYVYRGVATPETAPTGTDTPWCRVFYLAGPGTYKNFGGLTVEPGELAALLYDGNGTSGSWRKETVPASSSGSLRLDEVVDLSGITDGTKWTDDDKVNALYNIRNGSYVYCGAGDGGQAASVELTQDSSGSRLEIALLGTDGRLKVYAADISDADVTATWSVKDYDLSLLGRFPASAQNIRSLDQADGREVTEAGVAKVLARLLYSGTVGLCTLDTSATPSPVMSTASSLKGITYYGKVKKIYANGTDGKVYEDWLSADVEPRCMSSREFLAGDDNTPLTGKVYLMNDAAGNLSLRYWTGSDMALLMDFTATLNRITDMEGKIIPKVQAYSSATGRTGISLSYDVVVVDIGTTSHTLVFSGSPVSGHRTTVYVYNGSVSDASKVSLSSDKLALYTVNGANELWLAPNGFLRVDADYVKTDLEESVYLKYERTETPLVREYVDTISDLPAYADVIIVKDYGVSEKTSRPPLSLNGSLLEGHHISIYIEVPPGGKVNFIPIDEEWKLYGNDYGKSSVVVNTTTGETVAIYLRRVGQEVYATVVHSPNQKVQNIIKVNDGDIKTASGTLSLIESNLYNGIHISTVAFQLGAHVSALIKHTGDYPVCAGLQLSNYFDDYTFVYAGRPYAPVFPGGYIYVDITCIAEKTLLIKLDGEYRTFETASPSFEYFYPGIRYIFTEPLTKSYYVRLMNPTSEKAIEPRAEEYYIRFRTGAQSGSLIFASSSYGYDTLSMKSFAPGPNKEALITVSEGYVDAHAWDSPIQAT